MWTWKQARIIPSNGPKNRQEPPLLSAPENRREPPYEWPQNHQDKVTPTAVSIEILSETLPKTISHKPILQIALISKFYN